LRLAFRHVAEMRRSGATSRYIRWRASGRQSSRLEPDERIEGACTHCGQCCTNKACVFVQFDALGRSSCRIYDTAFWRWLSCGSYPVSREDIEVYRCPSFKVIRIQPVPRNAGGGADRVVSHGR
jgi:TPP-dependent indolepyruvate ferredoxin oxidoreductase alpha subunit